MKLRSNKMKTKKNVKSKNNKLLKKMVKSPYDEKIKILIGGTISPEEAFVN
jgi:hypothetical protein